jgi:hypothetical protein
MRTKGRISWPTSVEVFRGNFLPHERYGSWVNELESLGIGVKKTNEFNDLKEPRGLTEIIKQGFYQDYKTDNYRL